MVLDLFWNARRDLAAVVIVASTVAVVFLVGGFRSAGPSEQAAVTAQLGTVTERVVQPDPFAPATTEEAPTEPAQPKPEHSPNDPAKKATTETADNEQREPTENDAPKEEVENPAADPKTDIDGADQPAEPREKIPENPVERKIKKVHEMSPQEIADTLADYRQWLQNGNLRITLDHTRVSAEQLKAIVSYYIIRSRSNNFVRVRPDGRYERLTSFTDEDLMGELSVNKWPSLLSRASAKVFGPHNRSDAVFVLHSHCVLQIFRYLAPKVGSPDSRDGEQHVVLRLIADKEGKLRFGLLE